MSCQQYTCKVFSPLGHRETKREREKGKWGKDRVIHDIVYLKAQMLHKINALSVHRHVHKDVNITN